MGRRPHEDDEEEYPRGKTQMTGRGRPADHGRDGTGTTTDNDVLVCGPLEDDAVENNVVQDASQ